MIGKRAVLLLVCFVPALTTGYEPCDQEEPECPAEAGKVACWDGFELKSLVGFTNFQECKNAQGELEWRDLDFPRKRKVCGCGACQKTVFSFGIAGIQQTLWKCAEQCCPRDSKLEETDAPGVGPYDQKDVRCCTDGDYCDPSYGLYTCKVKAASEMFDHYESGCGRCQESRSQDENPKSMKSCLKPGQKCGHGTPKGWTFGCCEWNQCDVEDFTKVKSEESAEVTDGNYEESQYGGDCEYEGDNEYEGDSEYRGDNEYEGDSGYNGATPCDNDCEYSEEGNNEYGDTNEYEDGNNDYAKRA